MKRKMNFIHDQRKISVLIDLGWRVKWRWTDAPKKVIKNIQFIEIPCDFTREVA